MLKKSSLSLAHSGLECCVGAHTGAANSSTSPSVLPHPRTRPTASGNKRRKTSTQWRSYATATDFRDNMHWPSRSKSHPSALPTPYEIFALEKHAIYSKHRFYELVKIYHPDRHTHTTFPSPLSPLECLERYRLVVQAHEILSDPVKRRAYDASGAGWGAEATRNNYSSRRSRGYASAASPGKNYGQGPDDDSSPFANATWEDWERWYARTTATPQGHGPAKQSYQGTYVNPNAFASFVILMAVLSGVWQATRAGQYAGSIEERAAAFTEETNRFLTERAGAYSERGMDREGRIRHFLEKRDPTRYGLRDEEEETYRRHFGGRGREKDTEPAAGTARDRSAEKERQKTKGGDRQVPSLGQGRKETQAPRKQVEASR